MDDYVYVCMKVYFTTFPDPDDNENSIRCFNSPDVAQEWLLTETQKNIKGGYVPSPYSELILQDGSINEDMFYQCINRNGVDETMFYRFASNYDDYYEISIVKHRLETSIDSSEHKKPDFTNHSGNAIDYPN